MIRQTQVTVVTVAHNSLGVLPAMLASLPDGTPTTIVDNASENVAALRALATAHDATLLENGSNLGFGVACNKGADMAATEFLLFLNPDATVAPDTIEQLIEAARRYPHAVAFNPRIADAAGKPYFKRRSSLLPSRASMPRGWPAADREVSVLSGAALFVRRADFEAVGGFDPIIFLYHEDDDLSLRLAARGPLMFIRGAEVWHQGGRSSVRSADVAALKAWHMGRSCVYAMRKHGRSFAFSRAFASAIVQLAAPDAWLFRRKRAKQRAFLRGVLGARNLRPVSPETKP